MQSLYAMHQQETDNFDREEKLLLQSLHGIKELYLLILSIFIELQKKETQYLEKVAQKYLASKEEKNPSKNFINNKLLTYLSNNKNILHELKNYNIKNWQNNDDMILILLNEIKLSSYYENYISIKNPSFEDDKKFIVNIFSYIIAASDKLYDYLEDYKISWVDDIPVVNTIIVKQLRNITSTNDEFEIAEVYKDDEDEKFAKDLLVKTLLNFNEYSKYYIDKTPNWDIDRFAELDTILLKMGICELLKFSNIPVKVTINEYVEIAKEYSTPKSSLFINGILDNLVKEFQQKNILRKSGRGLL